MVRGIHSRRSYGALRRYPFGADDPLVAERFPSDCGLESSSGASTGTTDTTLAEQAFMAPPHASSGGAASENDAPDSPSTRGSGTSSRTGASLWQSLRGAVWGVAAFVPTVTSSSAARAVKGSGGISGSSAAGDGHDVGDGGRPDSGGGGATSSAVGILRNRPRSDSNDAHSEAAAHVEVDGNVPIFAGLAAGSSPPVSSEEYSGAEDVAALEPDASRKRTPNNFHGTADDHRGSLPDRAAAAAKQFADNLASAAASAASIDVRGTLDGALDGFWGNSAPSGSSAAAQPQKARRRRRRFDGDAREGSASGEEDVRSNGSETWSPEQEEESGPRLSLGDDADDPASVRSMHAQNAAVATTEDTEPAAQRRKEGRNAVVASDPNLLVVQLDALMEEVRKPFGQLLIETPDAATLLEVESVDSRSAENPVENEGRPPFSTLVRGKLIDQVLACCDAVANELSGQEAQLWNAFVAQDLALQGMLAVKDEDIRQVLRQFSSSKEAMDQWVCSIVERANGDSEIDFADLLDWLMYERPELDEQWTFHSTLRTGLSRLFSTTANADSAPPRLLLEHAAELRDRCARADPVRLAEAAAAYQRSMVLTACWRCEQHLRKTLSPIVAGSRSSDGIHGRPPGTVSALLAVLRSIHAELAPSERVLWELMGSSDGNFDGALLQSEAMAAISELYRHALGPENDATQAEFEELQRLRADCQRQSVEALFQDGAKRTANLADVLKWWWDMPEDYRIAAGLAVPAELLRRGLRRQPEEMFRMPLRRVAADPAATRIALKGHVRVFADLRALCVRRTIEGMQSSPPTETRTTTTSEADLTSMEGDDDHEVAQDMHQLETGVEQEERT